MDWNEKIGSLYDWMLLKVPIVSKQASIKKLSRIKFPKKKLNGCISLSLPGVELGGAKHLPCTGMEK